MKDVDVESSRPVTTGTVITLLSIAVMAVAIGYNALSRQSPQVRSGNDNAVHVQPDRIGNLITDVTEIPASRKGRRTRVRVEPDGLAGSGQRHSAIDAALILASQRQLKSIGIYRGTVNGRLDQATQNAILQFQISAGLPPTGRPDRALLEHVRYQRTIAEAVRFSERRNRSEADADLRMVQLRLAELGYEPGPVDGAMGSLTRRAIARFQRDRRLPEDGKVSASLLAELNKLKGQTAVKR